MSFFSLLGLHTETCGIDIGLHAIYAVQLRKPRQHSSIVSSNEIVLPPKIFDSNGIIDQSSFVEVLKKLTASATPHPITAKIAVAAIPENFIFNKIIQLPNLPPQELQKAIRYEVEQYLPMPIEELYFDYVPLALVPDKQKIDAALFAVPQKIVDSLVEVMHLAGLELYALETKSTAISRALLPFNNQEAVLIIEIGSETTRMAVIDHGNLWLTTSVNLGEMQIVKSLCTKTGLKDAQLKEKLPDDKAKHLESATSLSLDGIVQEANNLRRYHETRDFQPTKITRGLVTGQGATLPHITTVISELLDLKCELGTPLVSGTNKIDLKYGVALGLGMRSL